MAGERREQDTEEYGWFAARVGSQSEPNISNLAGIQHFCNLGYRIPQF